MAQSRTGDDRIYTQQPLQTELMAPLDASRAKPGALAVAKVLYNWNGPACTLASGSTVTGEVVAAQVDKATKTSTITLRFDGADCNGKLGQALTLRVFALIFAPPPAYDRAFADQGGLFGNYQARTPKAPGGGSAGPAAVPADLMNDMTTGPGKQQKLPAVIKAGMVFGDKQVTLDLDGGPDGSSVVRKADKSFRMERGTKLVLMPRLVAEPLRMAQAAEREATSAPVKTAEVETVKSSELAVAVLPVRPKDETEVCATACSAEAGRREEVPATMANPALNMASFGYTKQDRRELQEFHHAYTLTYLDAGHLLFTFDMHTMRVRQTGGLHPDYVHTVRAVVIDPATQAIRRVVDWQVLGEEQYVWPASPGHVLVHLGRQLRLIDVELKTVKSYDLAAPLAWVATAPGGATFAAGMLSERHTDSLHRRLADINGSEPEESVDVHFLDADLKQIGTSTQPNTVSPPVLTAHGELRILSLDQHQWELEEFGWDRTRRRIATAVSDCQPRVSLATITTVFVAGCQGGQNWYRALRLDGHTVLRGAPSSQQLEQAAAGDAGDDAFAVRIVWSALLRSESMRIKSADLRGEQIGVYRASDGQRLLLSRVEDVPLAEQSFALAPGAQQLAVMGTKGIYLFAVDTTSKPAR